MNIDPRLVYRIGTSPLFLLGVAVACFVFGYVVGTIILAFTR